MAQAFKLVQESFDSSEIKKLVYKKMSTDSKPYVKITLHNKTSYLLYYSISGSETKWVKQ